MPASESCGRQVAKGWQFATSVGAPNSRTPDYRGCVEDGTIHTHALHRRAFRGRDLNRAAGTAPDSAGHELLE